MYTCVNLAIVIPKVPTLSIPVFKPAVDSTSRISTCTYLIAFNLFVDIQCISYVCVIFFREPNLLTKTLDTARYNELQQNLKVTDYNRFPANSLDMLSQS